MQSVCAILCVLNDNDMIIKRKMFIQYYPTPAPAKPHNHAPSTPHHDILTKTLLSSDSNLGSSTLPIAQPRKQAIHSNPLSSALIKVLVHHSLQRIEADLVMRRKS